MAPLQVAQAADRAEELSALDGGRQTRTDALAARAAVPEVTKSALSAAAVTNYKHAFHGIETGPLRSAYLAALAEDHAKLTPATWQAREAAAHALIYSDEQRLVTAREHDSGAFTYTTTSYIGAQIKAVAWVRGSDWVLRDTDIDVTVTLTLESEPECYDSATVRVANPAEQP